MSRKQYLVLMLDRISLSPLFVILVCWLSLGPASRPLLAQANLYPDRPYPFVRHDLNLIDNNYRGLRQFYRQLDQLERGVVRTVNIVHIGDSHIQADWFSGSVRKGLQQEFGAAGRGLVFPYQVAHTNGPSDLISSSNVPWRSRRNAQSRPNLPIGLSGITIQSLDPGCTLRLSVKSAPEAGFEYQFNKVTLFTSRGPSQFDLQVSTHPIQGHSLRAVSAAGAESTHQVQQGETLGLIAAQYRLSIQQLKELNGLNSNLIYAGQKLVISRSKRLDELGNPPEKPAAAAGKAPIQLSLSQPGTGFATTLYLDEASRDLYLRCDQTSQQQTQFTFYGMVLENYHQRGILYHSIGVNGATFEDFNQSAYFMEQLAELKPDLIIVSLGTNETVNQVFPVAPFSQEVDQLIRQLGETAPQAAILLTTPPDALRARRYPNPSIAKAQETLLAYSLSNGLGCWDLYHIMGGAESVHDWFRAGLAQGDRLHFTRKGYEFQGQLLVEAILNGYGSFRAVK